MSTQISYEKLDNINLKLVKRRYGGKREELLNKLNTLVTDLIISHIPEDVMEAFNKNEAAHIAYIYAHDPHAAYVSPRFFLSQSKIYLWSSSDSIEKLKRQYFERTGKKISGRNANIQIELNQPLPVTNDLTTALINKEVDTGGEISELLYKIVELDAERAELDNKIHCLFRSKRFYPKTLEKEFPEAYEIYMQVYGADDKKIEESLRKPQTNLCDSIENIRAALQSNK